MRLKKLVSQNHKVFLAKLLKEKKTSAVKPSVWPRKVRESLIPKANNEPVSINTKNFKEINLDDINASFYTSTSDIEQQEPDTK
jgi:hypothetical protein